MSRSLGPKSNIRPYTGNGKNDRMGNACETKNSIIMDHCHIGHLSYVRDNIVGEKCILGDNVKTGINSLLMPGVKVGANSWVGPNVVVERDVAADTIVLLKQTVEKRLLKP